MSTFWERQRAKMTTQQGIDHLQPAQPSEPFWRNNQGYPNQSPAQYPQQPQNGLQGRIDPTAGPVQMADGSTHDFSQATHLRDEQECMNCPVDPKSGHRGNMMRATKNSLLRCFNCGYTPDRETHDRTAIPPSSVGDHGPSQKARQTVSGGVTGHNYHGYTNEGMPVQGVDR